MAIALNKTKLPLDRWAEIIGLDPRHFNQVVTSAKPVHTCDKVWKQYAWQENDQVSREDVAMAVQQAENTIESYLGFHLLPVWDSEQIDTPQPGDRTLFYRTPLNYRGPLHIQTKWGHFISGGIEKKDLIDTPEVVYSDDDHDGYPETATIIFNTSVDPSEIAVFIPGTEYEIRPLSSVSKVLDVCTVKLWRHQLVDRGLWEALEPGPVDGENDANFVTEVGVYRRYNDPSQQVQMIWTQDNCENSEARGCLNAKDNRLGLVYYWNDSICIPRNPDRLKIWYYSGVQMEPALERAVAFYSLTLLDRPICGCNNLEKVVNKWTEDLGLHITTPETSSWYAKIQSNPLGTARGAIFAWEVISHYRIGRAVRY